MDIPIVYEDESLLVIDKPSGVVVNKAETVQGDTIQDWVDERAKSHKENSITSKQGDTDFDIRSGIVHRLDKDTSGLLILAKTPDSFSNLQRQFKERLVTKRYLALAHGKIVPSTGEITATVGRLPWNRERFGVISGGREAHTSYSVISLYMHEHMYYSLIEVTPLTGRTHQIRVHLKYLGFPVVADNLYAGRKTYRRDVVFCPRLFLHAAYVRFEHPQTGKMLECTSKLPGELQNVIKKLRKVSD